MKIDNNTYVALQYLLNEVSDDGTEIMVEETDDEQPMEYIHGMGLLLPEFEKQLSDLSEGDAFDFVLSPEEAYGPFQSELLMDLDKSLFVDADGDFDDGFVQVGRYVPMRTADGQTVNGLVLDITDDKVRMDFNHPLSGKTLHFSGRVQEARPATDDEVQRFDRMLHGHSCCCGGDDEESCSCGHHHHHHHGDGACCGHCH